MVVVGGEDAGGGVVSAVGDDVDVVGYTIAVAGYVALDIRCVVFCADGVFTPEPADDRYTVSGFHGRDFDRAFKDAVSGWSG